MFLKADSDDTDKITQVDLSHSCSHINGISGDTFRGDNCENSFVSLLKRSLF